MPQETEAVSFPTWKAALRSEALPGAARAEREREILGFLHCCKVTRAPATVMLAREYLAERERQGANGARLALRWFFQAARRTAEAPASMPVATPAPGARPARAASPPPAAQDQGGADWERDLIKAARAAGHLWRTEETYRGWAARFARFLAPRSPYAAGAEDVAAFLTRLAVEQRASPSTQKQALNALVFLMQEGLHRQLGEIDFRRAAPQRRMPTVLSRDECNRLFAELEGTPRLMAELAYGPG